jgi:2-keto-4-pentenoate hydratase/2-oxohepta-3-ene-1,7-dioic acid hydratase in catechol pathway
MRLITAKLKDREILGLVNPEKTHFVKINTLGVSFIDMIDLINRITTEEFNLLSKLDFLSIKETYSLSDIEFLSPIPKPMHDIICLGVNYADHAEEFGSNALEVPVYFSKRAAVTTGHLGTLDGHFEVDEHMDYEVELAIIIGKKAKKIQPEIAEDFIFGYTLLNDFTSRVLQKRSSQWYLGKSTDGFAAMGPWIVTRDEIPMPFSLSFCSRVNGEVRQNSNTDFMIHGINKVLSEISQNITLYPGDIISMGTSAGVGMGFDPPKMLKSGDIVECEIEKVGILKNFVG